MRLEDMVNLPTVTDPDTGISYPLMAGGASDTVAAAEAMLASEAAGEDAGEAPPDPPEEASAETPDDGGTAAPSGQGLIDKYLEGLDDSTRDVVAERLEQFRKDADSQAGTKIQQLSEKLRAFEKFTDNPAELEPIVDFYSWLLNEPGEALPWAVEQLDQQHEGLKDTLLDKLGVVPGQQRADIPAEQQPTDDTEKPLTRKDLEEFEAQRRQKAEQEQDQQKRAREAADQLNSWTDDALKKFNLDQRVPADSPMRQFIYQQALQHMRQGGIRNGQVAIETAVEQVKGFLDSQEGGSAKEQGANGSPPRSPRTANAGVPMSKPEGFDPKDKKARVDLAASVLGAMHSEE